MNQLNMSAMLTAALASCATPNFNYKWYGIDPAAGKLLGPTEEQDIPLARCQGDELQKGKCAVLFIEEFERLQTDYIQIQVQLKECQSK